MIQTKRSLPTGAVRLAVFGLALVAVAMPALAEVDFASDSPSFLLHEGVLVAPSQGTVFVMQPGGGLGALGLDGATRWSSADAARPLATSGDRLIAQAEADGAFTLVGLDLASGAVAGSSQVELPEGVYARIDDNLRGTFDAAVIPNGGDLVVSWKSVERAVQAYLPSLEEDMSPGSENTAEVVRGVADKAIRASEGVLTLDATTFAARDRATKAVTFTGNGLPSLRELAAGQTIPGIPNEGRRFLSVDGSHVLLSERVSLGLVPVYRWTVFTRSGERLGSTETHVSAAPFAVADGQLLFVSRTAVGAGSESADLLLRGIDLASGAEQWKSGVRDTAFSGPFPH